MNEVKPKKSNKALVYLLASLLIVSFIFSCFGCLLAVAYAIARHSLPALALAFVLAVIDVNVLIWLGEDL